MAVPVVAVFSYYVVLENETCVCNEWNEYVQLRRRSENDLFWLFLTWHCTSQNVINIGFTDFYGDSYAGLWVFSQAKIRFCRQTLFC